MNTYFITGIGTDVGKTLVAAILVEALHADYWKPVQAGDLDYGDKQRVQNLVSNTTSRFFENSYRLQTPMSPHAAAEIDSININLKYIRRPKTENNLVIEGAGGLLVPLNIENYIVDLITLKDKIILVSRHYLGSINHTLLSVEALKNRGFSSIGIVFSGDEHISTESIILSKTGVRFLGRIPELPIVDKQQIFEQAQMLKSSFEFF